MTTTGIVIITGSTQSCNYPVGIMISINNSPYYHSVYLSSVELIRDERERERERERGRKEGREREREQERQGERAKKGGRRRERETDVEGKSVKRKER